MKTKAVLSISVVYEDFSLTPDQIRKLLQQNLNYCINRGMITEELSAVVKEWSLSLDFTPKDLTMESVIYLKVIYESSLDESLAIKSTLLGLAEYLASRGYLTDGRSVIQTWDAQVNVSEV